MPLTSKWPFHEFHDPVKSQPELLRLLRLRWLPVPCRLLRRFPWPFSSRSTFACDATWPSNQCSLPKRFDDSMCMTGSILYIYIYIYLSRKAKQFQRSEENCFRSYSLRMFMGSNYAVRHSHGKVRDVKDTMRFIVK